MMFLVGCALYEDPTRTGNPNHPDGENLLEREHDLKPLESLVRFFQRCGAKDMEVEDLE